MGNQGRSPCEQTPPGRWVRASVDAVWDVDHVLVIGMLGQVVEDRWQICTPGVSLYVQEVGASQPFVYPCSWFEVVEETPTEQQVVESRQLYRNRALVLQQRRGWQGLIQDKSRIREDRSIRQEIEALCIRLEGFTTEQAKEVKGTLRRLRNLMAAYVVHPRGQEADRLAAMATEGLKASSLPPELVSRVRAWLADVEANIQPRQRPSGILGGASVKPPRIREDDGYTLTYENVSLTVGGLIHVPWPSGTYEIGPKQPLLLSNILAEALEGWLDQHQYEEIAVQIRRVCQKYFEGHVEALELERQAILLEEDLRHPESAVVGPQSRPTGSETQ